MTQVNYKEVLLAAAARIEKPGAWTTGTSARTATGQGTASDAADAVCWCTIGAIGAEVRQRMSNNTKALTEINEICDLVVESIGHGEYHLALVNDSSTQEAMVALLRKTAESIPA